MADWSAGSKVKDLPIFSKLPSSFQYSSSLNCIILLSDNFKVKVFDLNSYNIITQVAINDKQESQQVQRSVLCKYIEDEDKLIISYGSKLGCRSSSRGRIFLDMILHVPDFSKSKEVKIELSTTKAELLLKGFQDCLQSSTQAEEAQLHVVIQNLKKSYKETIEKIKKNVPTNEVKWQTVLLAMDHSTLTKSFNVALLICKQHHRGPALPIIGDVLQRLTALERTTNESYSSEKRLMLNEVDRLQTFSCWPHMDYKWGLPGPMAEAGFYHPPSGTTKPAEDRAGCFTCCVCLVSWESSDQPWSEHKRHSPNCPYVTGEYTENVPLQVYAATARAQELQRPDDEIICMSGSCNNLIATGTKEGYIVIWSLHPTLKVHSEYQISVSAMKKSKRNKSKDPKEKKKSDVVETVQCETKENEEVATPNIKQENKLSYESHDVPEVRHDKTANEISKQTVEIESTLEKSNITDILVDGESYCVIEELVIFKKTEDGDDESSSKAKKESKEKNDSASGEKLEEKSTDVPITKQPEDEVIDASKVSSFERNCKITSVAILDEESTKSIYVVSGVKIQSKKVRRNKMKLKNKLSLLVYKLAGKEREDVQTPKKNGMGGSGSSNSEVGNTPGYSLGGATSSYYDVPNSFPIDLSFWDGVEPPQLNNMIEYMSQQKPPSNYGGTQNIAFMNEPKAGFEQEEIIQIDDVKTVYEDCVFHKFDIAKMYYEDSDMYIAEMLVIDYFLVVILKESNETENESLESTSKSATTAKPLPPEKANNVILVFSIQSNPQESREIKLVNSKILEDVLIQDAIQVSTKNLPSYLLANLNALDTFEAAAGSSNTNISSNQKGPKELLLVALSDNTLCYITVPSLHQQKFPITIDEGNYIHKIAYLSRLMSVGICDTMGNFYIQPCSKQPPFLETSLKDVTFSAEMIEFEPVSLSSYISCPVNPSRSGPKESFKTLQNYKNVFTLYPVDVDPTFEDRKKSSELRLDELVFEMLVMVKTYIGYLDISVSLKSPLPEHQDFSCSVYIDNSDATYKYSNRQKKDENSQKQMLIYGPVLFSSITSDSLPSGQFTVMVPELHTNKSLLVIVKLKTVYTGFSLEKKKKGEIPEKAQKIEKNEKGSDNSENSNTLSNKNTKLSFLVKDVHIGVHQFKETVGNNGLYFHDCRKFLIEDEKVQRDMVDKFLRYVQENASMNEDLEIKLTMTLLIYIASVYRYALDKEKFYLPTILSKRMHEFVKATLVFGDRSICYSACQLLVLLSRTCTDCEFKASVLEEIWKLVRHVHEATSSAAVHCIFILLLEFSPTSLGSKEQDKETLIKLKKILKDFGSEFGERILSVQKILDARHGLSDPIFEPVLAGPGLIKVCSGNTIKKAFTRVLEVVQLPGDYLPGILEVQPLHFVCTTSSEGARAEQLKQPQGSATTTFKTTPQETSSMQLHQGVDQQDSSSFFSVQDYMPSALSQPGSGKFLETIDEFLPQFSTSINHNQNLHEALTSTSTSSGLKIIKSKTARVNTAKFEHVSREESVIPPQYCLFVDNMLVYSVHHVILDFEEEIQLTDFILPPCSALSSVTVTSWTDHTPEDDIKIVYSEQINKKALVVSNLTCPIKLRYVKVVVVGKESCSAVISLGQYFGYSCNEKIESTGSSKNLEKQFADVFCRYASASERIVPFDIRGSTKRSVGWTNNKRDYHLCSHLQLCLNFLGNNRTWSNVQNLLQARDLQSEFTTSDTLSDKSISTQQYCLKTLLKAISYYLSVIGSKSLENSSATSGDNQDNIESTDIFTKDEFLKLFKKICINGLGDMQEMSASVLFNFCKNCLWWNEAVIEIFQICFGKQYFMPIPLRRLFNIWIKLVRSSGNVTNIVERMLNLLKEHIRDLTTNNDNSYTPNHDVTAPTINPMMLDWILVALNQILHHPEIRMWRFSTPWIDLTETNISNSAQTAKSSATTPLQNSASATSSTSTPQAGKTKSSPSPAKKYSPLVSCTITKKNPPEQADSTSADESLLHKDCAVKITGNIFLSKSTSISVLSSLINFLLKKLDHGNADQLILICKVCSLILHRCQGLVHIGDFLEEGSLKQLLGAVLDFYSERRWLSFSINLLLKSIFVQKDHILKGIGIFKTAPTKSTVKGDVGSSKKSGSDGKVSTKEKSKLNQMKAMEESINKKFYENTMKVKSGERFGDNGPVDNETQPPAIDCTVIHTPCQGFFKIPQSDILSLQTKMWNLKLDFSDSSSSAPSRKNKSSQQNLWIPSSQQYVDEVLVMKSSTMSFVLSVLQELFGEYEGDVELAYLQQLLFFLKISHKANFDINDNVLMSVCNHFLECMKKSRNSSNPTFSSIVKTIMKFLLKSNTIATAFTLQLLQVSEETIMGVNDLMAENYHSTTATSPMVLSPSREIMPSSSSPSLAFIKLHIVSLKRLCEMKEWDDQERLLLKQLLLKVCSLRFESGPKLLSALNEIIGSEVFVRWSDQKETNVTMELTLTLSKQVKEFVKDSAQLLRCTFHDRIDMKTHFIIHNGRYLAPGKVDLIFKDLNLVISYLAIVQKILSTKILYDATGSREEIFFNLFQTLSLCGKLSNTLNKNNSLKSLSNLPDEMKAFQSSSKLHPLPSAIVYILLEAFKVPVLINDVVSSLVKTLQCKENRKDKFFSLEGIQYFIKKGLTQSKDGVECFLKTEGFALICREISRQGSANDIGFVDTTERSQVLQDIYSCSIMAMSKRALDNEKLKIHESMKKDENGNILENFAPYAKISGPSSSPGYEVLLGNKSRYRRLRFPAWGHTFVEGDDNWITLVIEFPFEIMLTEIDIYMHHSYITGAPSGVVVETKNQFKDLVVTPTLPTGGLQSIILRFTESLLCKKVRLMMLRPSSGNHIKMNLIEMHGKSIFPFDELGSLSLASKTIFIEPWINLLCSLLTDQKEMLERFLVSSHFEQCFSCLVVNMPFLSRKSQQIVAVFLISNIVQSTCQSTRDKSLKMATLVIECILSRRKLHFYNFKQLQLMGKFLGDIMTHVDDVMRERIFCNLLNWFQDVISVNHGQIDDAMVNVVQLLVSSDILQQKVTLSEWKEKDSLLGKLQDMFVEGLPIEPVESSATLFFSLGQLLYSLLSISPSRMPKILYEALTSFENVKSSSTIWNSRNEDSMQVMIFSCCSVNKEACTSLLDDIAQHMYTLLSTNTQNISNIDIKKMRVYLNVFQTIFSARNSYLKGWFHTEKCQRFWKPLLRFLARNGNDLSNNSLCVFYLLKISIEIFKKIMYLNPDTQNVLCTILIDLLKEPVVMTGNLKFIILQLVLTEDLITVTFKPRFSGYLLKNSQLLKLNLSSTIGEIIKTLLRIRNEMTDEDDLRRGESSEPSDTSNGKQKATSHTDSSIASTSMLDSSNYVGFPGGFHSTEYDHLMKITNALVIKRSKGKSEKKQSKKLKKINPTPSVLGMNINVDFFLPAISTDECLPLTATVGQIVDMLLNAGCEVHQAITLEYSISSKSSTKSTDEQTEKEDWIKTQSTFPTMLERFASQGGLPLLATAGLGYSNNGRGLSSHMTLFSLILPLPGFAPVFLQDRTKAEWLLRLMLGMKETRQGQLISGIQSAQDLSTLPLISLRNLMQQTSISTQDGLDLRKLASERGVLKFVLVELKELYSNSSTTKSNKTTTNKTPVSVNPANTQPKNGGDQNYWAKGTGFGTGSTVSSWDIDNVMKQKKKDEADIIYIFQILTAFIQKTEGDVEDNESAAALMTSFEQEISSSCVMDILNAYLRNDSVLDISWHIPMYNAILAFVLPLACWKQTITLLVKEGSVTVPMLSNLKQCVALYNLRLSVMKKKKVEGKKNEEENVKEDTKPESNQTSENEGSNNNKPIIEADIEDLGKLLDDVTSLVKRKFEEYLREKDNMPSTSGTKSHDKPQDNKSHENDDVESEEKYVNEMIRLQFDTYEIAVDGSDGKLKFSVPYHYASSVSKVSAPLNRERAKRLAKEIAVLSSSLPISYSSTVFLQCDVERLDVMKVLITGPEGTPYENGCFEFDIYFPSDYPISPMFVNLNTTGKNTVRFNPNLYKDGKVCLSILNTWHGRPEEKWNASTSNLLQVLVSIQSLILVAEPYFNEPGYERLRGTPQGLQNSLDYNANIQQACVKWAILEQIKRPSDCFKDIIHKHFLYKKEKVLTQCQRWLDEMKSLSSKRKSTTHSYESLKTHFIELKHELAKLEKAHREGIVFPTESNVSISEIGINTPQIDNQIVYNDVMEILPGELDNDVLLSATTVENDILLSENIDGIDEEDVDDEIDNILL